MSPKSSFSQAIRAEGVLFILVSVLGGSVYRVSMYLLGLAGAIALFVPNQALRFSMNISYESSEAIEWKDELVPVIRGFGVLYLLIAFNEVKTRNQET